MRIILHRWWWNSSRNPFQTNIRPGYYSWLWNGSTLLIVSSYYRATRSFASSRKYDRRIDQRRIKRMKGKKTINGWSAVRRNDLLPRDDVIFIYSTFHENEWDRFLDSIDSSYISEYRVAISAYFLRRLEIGEIAQPPVPLWLCI